MIDDPLVDVIRERGCAETSSAVFGGDADGVDAERRSRWVVRRHGFAGEGFPTRESSAYVRDDGIFINVGGGGVLLQPRHHEEIARVRRPHRQRRGARHLIRRVRPRFDRRDRREVLFRLAPTKA